VKKVNIIKNQNRIVLYFIVLLSLILTLQSYLQKNKVYYEGGGTYTYYNNYVIFKQSFEHLIQNKDLYAEYNSEYWDLYKYSPAFAVLMAPFYYMPDLVGLFLWNLLNGLILFWALYKLPLALNVKRLIGTVFILLESVGSFQNEQSNCLIAGLMILGFLFMEKRNIMLASLFIVLTGYIKIFGIVALAMFLFYPQKLKAAFWTIVWTVAFAFLPLIIVSYKQLIFLYQSWGDVLSADHGAYYGISLMGIIKAWFHAEPNKDYILIFGVIAFFIPFLRFNQYRSVAYRLLFLANALLWVILFNHRSESPTFVIALTGCAIWLSIGRSGVLNWILMGLVFLLTILPPTDVFPAGLRENYVYPLVLKVLPIILVWIKLMYDMITINFLEYRSSDILKS
jgi:hypothetical protein